MKGWRLITLFLAFLMLTIYVVDIYAVPAASSKSMDSPTIQLVVQPTIVPPGPSPTPIVCTRNLSDISIQIVPGARSEKRSSFFQSIQVEGMGFAPKEKLYIVVEGHGQSQGERTEFFDIKTDSDGVFTVDDSLPLDEPNMQWQVYVVHQRGVACASFTTGQ